MLAPLKPGAEVLVQEQLARLDYVGLESANDVLGFADVESLHFACLFLYDDPTDGWALVFECNIDGDIEPFLERLLNIAQAKDGGRTWLGLFEKCRDLPSSDLKSVKHYLLDRVQQPSAGFIAGVGLTRDRIRKDAAIHRVVDRVLGNGAAPMGETEALQQVLTALRSDAVTRDSLDMAGDGGRGLGLWARIIGWATALGIAVGFAAFGLINWFKERAAGEDRSRPRDALLDAQRHYEDRSPTNHMASIAHLHPDWSRQRAKRIAYSLLSTLVRLRSFRGELGGIASIHFAHWAILNGGRRLLFVSNFDGSWDSYLDDFTLKAPLGLTLAWAHCTDFPRSRFMLRGGAANGPQFIDWARRTMVPCPVWYSAYPGLSARNIVRNRALREELITASTDRTASRWLEYV